jgi:tRNA threonylcarbamoyladenosine modification (KEOPS) complex  Pcc1 subunit
MTETRGTLIGIYKADGGIVGELSYFFGHLIGVRSCTLCDITHSPIMKKSSFKALERHLLAEHGVAVRMLHMNERNEREQKASEGREPCILLEYPDESISMFIDSADLATLSGSVSSLKRLIKSRLDLYL